ncbi:MAG: beta strand repeat-containing protein [bacterium]
MKIYIVFIVLLLSTLIAQVPQTFNYQGKLTDPAGVAVDSPVDIVFSIYDTPTGGTPLWTENHTAVSVNKGLFDVILGTITPLNLPFSEPYYIQLSVEGEILSPRTPLNSVPYSLMADSAMAVHWDDVSGRPSIIDTDPTNELITSASYTHGTHTLTITEAGADWNIDLSDLDNPGTDNQSLSYTASTRTLNITGGTGTTLPLVSSSDAGLAPSSGGGTSNFLRADGTWASPSTGDNNYVNGVSFNTGSGVLTLSRAGLGDLSQNLDGRYLTGNQTITLSGDVSGSGTTSISTTLENDVVYEGNLAMTVHGGTSEDGHLLAYDNTTGGFTWVEPADVGGVNSIIGGTNISVSSGTGNVTVNVSPQGTGSGLDADQLDGQHGSYYRNASNINAGTLHTDRFSAYDDLVAESKIGTGSAQVASGDHDHDADYDDYNSWNLRANTEASTAVGSGATVSFTGSGGASVSRSGTTITIDASSAGDNWGSQVASANARLTGNGTSGSPLDIAQQGASSGQVLKWNGSSWAPGSDNNTTYSAGTGIDITGTTITNTAPHVGTNIAQGTRTSTTVPVTSSTGSNATLQAATTSLAGVMTSADKTKLDGIDTDADNYDHWNLQAEGGATTAISSGEAVNFTGTGGAAVSRTGNTIDIDVSGASDGNNYVTGASFSGTTTKTLTLTRSGLSNLTADFTDNNTTYSAGTGLSLVGTTFNHNAHSGDVSGTTSLTVTGLQGRGVASTLPSSGEVLKWNGSSWAPAADATGSNNYVSSVSFNTSTGDLTLTRSGLSSLTANLDGRYLTSISETDPTWSGTANTTSTIGRTGDVGIGTTSPSYKLDVSGYFRVNSTTYPGRDYRIQCGARQDIYAANDLVEHVNGNKCIITGASGGANDQFQVAGVTEGNKILVVDGNDERVGIGTTTPSYELDVSGVGYFSNQVGIGTSPGSYGLNVQPGTGVSGARFRGDGGSGPYVYLSYIDYGVYSYGTRNYFSGDVGIGTSTPSQRLHVNGDINASSGYGYRINNTAASGEFLRGNGTRFVSSPILAGDIPSGSSSYIWNQTASDQTAGFRISGNGLFNGGYIGIGTTSPSYPIDVSANHSRSMSINNNKTSSGSTYGIYNRILNDYAGSATNYGFYNYVRNNTSNLNNSTQYGFRNYLYNYGTGTSYGIYNYSYIYGDRTNYNRAIYNLAYYGDYVYGVDSRARYGNVSTYGLYGYAYSSNGTTYGVYGDASGATTNWAGYFASGNVNVENNLYVENRIGINTSFPSYRLHLYKDSDLYGFYAYSPSTEYGPGEAVMFGYRSGTSGATNGGSGWTHSTVDAAITGYSYWGNHYTAGVAGFNYNDYDSTAGVIGANRWGDYYGMLGYRDNFDNGVSTTTYYGGYFRCDSGTRPGYGIDVYSVGSSGMSAVRAQSGNSGYWNGWFYCDGGSSSPGLGTHGEFYASGSKSAMVETESYGTRALYCEEATEIWFTDYGSGKLIDGRCRIEIDPIFLQTVTIDPNNPMKVFVQLTDECPNQVYVKKGQNSFEVIEQDGGNSNATFDYRLIAKRKGYETRRLSEIDPPTESGKFRRIQEEPTPDAPGGIIYPEPPTFDYEKLHMEDQRLMDEKRVRQAQENREKEE